MQVPHPARDVKEEAGSSGQPELHVVVPVYNEAENFPTFHESLSRHVRTPFRLLVVYDHEEDTTLPVAREIARR